MYVLYVYVSPMHMHEQSGACLLSFTCSSGAHSLTAAHPTPYSMPRHVHVPLRFGQTQAGSKAEGTQSGAPDPPATTRTGVQARPIPHTSESTLPTRPDPRVLTRQTAHPQGCKLLKQSGGKKPHLRGKNHTCLSSGPKSAF